jgi:hypothetical protein
MARAVWPVPWLLFSLVCGPLSCRSKRSPEGDASQPSASAEAAEAAVPKPSEPAGRCREIGAGPGLRLGEPGPPRPATAEEEVAEDDETTLPFAASAGSALALGELFAVSAHASRAGTTEAFLGFVPADGAPGRSAALGRVHGDVDPPLISGRDGVVVALVPDSDAGGGMLRLARIDAGSGAVVHGAQLTGVDHEVGAGLALGEKQAIVVWAPRKGSRPALRLTAFDPAQPAQFGASHEVQGSAGAEAPELVARPGGFFLIWVAEGLPPDAGAKRPDAGALEEPLVALGPRVLTVLRLDADGKPMGSAHAVSGKDSHVVGFDAAVTPDGVLALAFRDDDTTPGVEAGALQLARVGFDGGIALGRLEDEDLSVGLPSLLRDPAPTGRVWVAVRSASEAARVGVLAPTALGVESLLGDALLRGADVLAAGTGKLLVSRGRGRALELDVLECQTK